jgi:hypothetical protein
MQKKSETSAWRQKLEICLSFGLVTCHFERTEQSLSILVYLPEVMSNHTHPAKESGIFFLPINAVVGGYRSPNQISLPRSIRLIVPKSYQTQHNEGGVEKTYLFSPASSPFQSKEACLRNFHMMSFCFSMNHACVVAIIAFAAPLIGSTGEMTSLYCRCSDV